jgi:O-antigen/teichoic acid export membrane protein
LAILSADSYGNSVAVVPLLACSGILYGTYYVFGTGLLIQGKTIFFPMITIAAAAVNIALNLILIPEFGIVGAGLATVITNFIMTLTVLSLSHRYYSISFGLRTVLLTGGAGIGAYTIHHAVRGHTHHPWIAAAVLLAGFGLLIWTSVRSFFGNESAGMDWQRSFRRSGTTP